MVAKKLDGRILQEELLQDLRLRAIRLREKDVIPGLGTILVGNDPGSEYYIKSLKHSVGRKVGIEPYHCGLPSSVTTRDVIEAVHAMNDNRAVHGLIVQLPLPSHIDQGEVIREIAPEKDADGLHPFNLGLLVHQNNGPQPCTPRGIEYMLKKSGVVLEGKRVVIVGRGITVGRTLGLLLSSHTNNATVIQTHSRSADYTDLLLSADVVIAAAGVPHLITASKIRSGAVVIDVGVSRVDGKICGDVHPSAWEKAGAISPNPGGVGPLTVGFLMANVVEAAEKYASV